jgi:hypothetical protein
MKNPVREILDKAVLLEQEGKKKWEGVDLGKFDPKEVLGYAFRDGEEVIDLVTGKRGKVLRGIRETIRYSRS